MTESEETLRYWLAQEDWYPSRYTQNFLTINPVPLANETLARIAADAEPEPHSYAALLYTAFATVGFLPSSGGRIPRRKAGVRAALLLAERGDARCLPALIRVFETDSVWQNKYQEQIAAAIILFLSRPPEGGIGEEYLAPIAALAERIWNTRPGRDLSPGFARLMLAALRFLFNMSPTAPLIVTISEDQPKGELRRHIAQMVRSLLDNEAPPR